MVCDAAMKELRTNSCYTAALVWLAACSLDWGSQLPPACRADEPGSQCPREFDTTSDTEAPAAGSASGVNRTLPAECANEELSDESDARAPRCLQVDFEDQELEAREGELFVWGLRCVTPASCPRNVSESEHSSNMVVEFHLPNAGESGGWQRKVHALHDKLRTERAGHIVSSFAKLEVSFDLWPPTDDVVQWYGLWNPTGERNIALSSDGTQTWVDSPGSKAVEFDDAPTVDGRPTHVRMTFDRTNPECGAVSLEPSTACLHLTYARDTESSRVLPPVLVAASEPLDTPWESVIGVDFTYSGDDDIPVRSARFDNYARVIHFR